MSGAGPLIWGERTNSSVELLRQLVHTHGSAPSPVFSHRRHSFGKRLGRVLVQSRRGPSWFRAPLTTRTVGQFLDPDPAFPPPKRAMTMDSAAGIG